MLQVTRAEGDPSRMGIATVRLDQLIGDLVDDCSIEARIRECRIVWTPEGPVQLEGNSELLRRAIENVIRNAIRYAPRQSDIEVTMKNASGHANIRVRDYGPGVPEESLRLLFDAFYRVEPDRDRKSGGAGLGLSIARRAVELHKGRLSASNAQPGLSVEIEIPV
jgi:two-component system sensor histidine kinase CpxA